jgi:peptidyl-prolyl cis-trans isomerase C
MSDKITASHILRMTSDRSAEDALKEINDIQASLEGGAEFADMAREHSECPSGRSGGDLGAFGRGAMVPEFDKVAFDLKIDEVSEVVETDFGYHLIQRTA